MSPRSDKFFETKKINFCWFDVFIFNHFLESSPSWNNFIPFVKFSNWIKKLTLRCKYGKILEGAQSTIPCNIYNVLAIISTHDYILPNPSNNVVQRFVLSLETKLHYIYDTLIWMVYNYLQLCMDLSCEMLLLDFNHMHLIFMCFFCHLYFWYEQHWSV